MTACIVPEFPESELLDAGHRSLLIVVCGAPSDRTLSLEIRVAWSSATF